jgi:hypothetical protein
VLLLRAEQRGTIKTCRSLCNGRGAPCSSPVHGERTVGETSSSLRPYPPAPSEPNRASPPLFRSSRDLTRERPVDAEVESGSPGPRKLPSSCHAPTPTSTGTHALLFCSFWNSLFLSVPSSLQLQFFYLPLGKQQQPLAHKPPVLCGSFRSSTLPLIHQTVLFSRRFLLWASH